MTNEQLEEYWNYLVDNNICSEVTLNIVTDLNGYSEQTLNDVLYVCTGYRDVKQFKESEEVE